MDVADALDVLEDDSIVTVTVAGFATVVNQRLET